MNGINALIKRPQNLPWPFLQVRLHQEDSSLKPKREFSPKPDHAATLISDFQAPEL